MLFGSYWDSSRGLGWLALSSFCSDAAAKSRNVDLVAIQRIGNHAVRHLEVKTSDTGPIAATVGRPPSGRFKARGIKHVGVGWIDGYVIDVAVFVEGNLPSFARIFGN